MLARAMRSKVGTSTEAELPKIWTTGPHPFIADDGGCAVPGAGVWIQPVLQPHLRAVYTAQRPANQRSIKAVVAGLASGCASCKPARPHAGHAGSQCVRRQCL